MEHLIKSQKNKPRHTNEQKVHCETREAPLGDDNRSEQMQTGFSFVPIRVIRGSRFLVPAMLA